MIKVAVYARVSTELQKDDNTIQAQMSELMKVINENNYSLSEDHIYKDDGWSGAYLNRPSLDKLRQAAKGREFDILLSYDRGRLARKNYMQELVIDELKSHGIAFKGIADKGDDTEDGIMVNTMLGVFAEWERLKIAERFRLGKLTKVDKGELLGYNPPYGYDYIPIQGKGKEKINGKFIINQAEARVVKKIFNWVDSGVSINDVIRKLEEEGIPPKKGKRNVWSKSPIIRILRNTSYIGQHYYNKSKSCIPKNPKVERIHFKHTNKTSRKNRDIADWLKVKSPIIIDKAQFDRVQDQLERNKKFAKRNAKHDYLLTSIIYCPCGCRRAADGGNEHYYYRCTDRQKRFPNEAECKEKGINTTMLDSVIWNELTSLLTTQSLLERQIERFNAKQSRQIDYEKEKAPIEKDLELLKAEETRYINAYGRLIIDEHSFEEQMRSIIKRREQFTKEISDIDNLKHQVIELPDTNTLSKQFSSLLSDLSFEEKQTITRKLINKVIATKKETTICGYIPIETNPPQEKAGLHVKYWNSRPTQRREVNLI